MEELNRTDLSWISAQVSCYTVAPRPQNGEAMDDQKEILLPVLLSVFFGGSAAGAAAIRKDISVGQALIAVATACIVSASFPFALMAFGLHWGLSMISSAILGLLIFGCLALVDKTEKKIPDLDVPSMLPSCIADKFKPKPPNGEQK